LLINNIEALLSDSPENSIGFYDKEIGKTVFLTKAEAEETLQKMTMQTTQQKNERSTI